MFDFGVDGVKEFLQMITRIYATYFGRFYLIFTQMLISKFFQDFQRCTEQTDRLLGGLAMVLMQHDGLI